MNIPNALKFFSFIYERQNIYHKKEVLNLPPPWTDDEILKRYHFCNVYRETDRSSRYLIETVLNKDYHPIMKFFNIIAYRFFNQVGLFDKIFEEPLHPLRFDFTSLEKLLDDKIKNNVQLFNTAYVTCGRAYNKNYRKNDKHIQVLLILNYLAGKIKESSSFVEKIQIVGKPYQAIDILKDIHGIGDFIASQIMVDLTYTRFFLHKFTSNNFCIIGPGAVGGIQQIEPDIPISKMKEYCLRLRDMQEDMFNRLKEETGKDWLSIHYKDAYCCTPYLSAMDMQGCLCEFRKYHKWPTESCRRRYYDYQGKYGVQI